MAAAARRARASAAPVEVAGGADDLIVGLEHQRQVVLGGRRPRLVLGGDRPHVEQDGLHRRVGVDGSPQRVVDRLVDRFPEQGVGVARVDLGQHPADRLAGRGVAPQVVGRHVVETAGDDDLLDLLDRLGRFGVQDTELSEEQLGHGLAAEGGVLEGAQRGDEAVAVASLAGREVELLEDGVDAVPDHPGDVLVPIRGPDRREALLAPDPGDLVGDGGVAEPAGHVVDPLLRRREGGLAVDAEELDAQRRVHTEVLDAGEDGGEEALVEQLRLQLGDEDELFGRRLHLGCLGPGLADAPQLPGREPARPGEWHHRQPEQPDADPDGPALMTLPVHDTLPALTDAAGRKVSAVRDVGTQPADLRDLGV